MNASEIKNAVESRPEDATGKDGAVFKIDSLTMAYGDYIVMKTSTFPLRKGRYFL